MTPHVPTGDEPRVEYERVRHPSVFDGLGGWVRAASTFTPDHPGGKAFLAAAAKTQHTPWLALQFVDPAVDEANRKAVSQGWIYGWHGVGVVVYGWWRVEQKPGVDPPDVDAIFDWIANIESPDEIKHLPQLLVYEPAAIITLPKAQGVDVDRLNDTRTHLIAECFRESAKSDGTVANSHAYWQAAGLNMHLWRPALQAYGEPFAPLPQQTEEALSVGARGVSIYPVEGASPAALHAVGEVFA